MAALGMLALVAATVAVLTPTAALAQNGASQRTVTPDTVLMPTRALSINPFLLLWGNVQAEFEQRINVRSAFAVSGSSMRFGSDLRYNNLDAKLRFYPAEGALEGLGVAAAVGVGQLRRDLTYYTCAGTGIEPACSLGKSSVTVPTFSMEATYQWLLGQKRATAVAVGFGAKRYFASRDDFRSEWRTWPTGRLTIGRAF